MLTDDLEYVSAAPYLTFLADTAGTYTPDDVLHLEQEGAFSSWPPSSAASPNTPIHWVHVPVRNATSHVATWAMRIRAQALHHAVYYQPSSDTSFVVQKMGTSLWSPEGNRYSTPTFLVHVLPLDTISVFLRIQTAHPATLSVSFTDADTFFATQKHRRYRIGLFLGITLGLFFYNLFLYLSIRLRDYLYYILYLGSTILYIMLYDGVLYEVTTWAFPYRLTQGLIVFALISTNTWMLQFIRRFLRLAERVPRWDIVMRFCLYIQLMWIPFVFLEQAWIEEFLYLMGFGVGIVALGLAWQATRQGFHPARYFVWSMLALMMGLTAEYLMYYDFIDRLFSGSGFGLGVVQYLFSYYGGTTAEMLLLSLALASLINETRREREEAQTDALRLEQEANELRAQYTAELQAEVERQTTEIATQNERLAQQAQQLRNLDAAKSRFFANISHELRTPLTLTIGPLEDLVAEKHGPLPDYLHTDLDLALRNSRRQLRLVNQILDVAKLEAGEMKLHAHDQDLNTFVGSLTLAFASLIERKAITFTFSPPSEPLPVYFDPDHLENILTNLLSNAFKFTPEGGAIYCGIEQRPPDDDSAKGWAAISIRDSGPGIAKDQQAHIFERFYQTDESLERRQVGTGIGLALVKELVALHRGIILVDSQPGFGATFTVLLRLGRDHLHPDEISASPVVSGQQPNVRPFVHEPARMSLGADEPFAEDQTTVLVIDDNADIRAYVRRHLESRYRVLEAANGQVGLDRIRQDLPDLVLSDVMMPELDGYALCDAVKQDPALSFIPFILLTARADRSDTIEGLGHGADDYITKPFQADELVARVDNLIASRKRLWERFEKHSLAKHPLLATPLPDVTSADASFLSDLRATIEADLADTSFDVMALAAAVGMSRASLYRRLNGLLDLSPNALILQMRLERGAQLLQARAGTVSEVAYAVGFKSVTHFSRRFRDQFGMAPSQYVAQSQDAAK